MQGSELDAAGAEVKSKSFNARLRLDAIAMREHFEREPFVIEHLLSDHLLLQLPRLIELAKVLPEKSVEFNRADIPLSQEYLKTPRNGLSVEETLHQIEQCRSWMVLKNVEQDAIYRALLLECIEELTTHTQALAPGACQPEGFIFVSSPQSVTPYHCDPEHNFLLQIRGSKTMAVYDRADPVAITPLHLEAMANGAHRNLPFREELHARERLFKLSPGLGLHVPVYCPHWVRVDDEVSISFSVTFRSRHSLRRDSVLRFNSRLRRLGLRPASPGGWAPRDEIKYFAERVIERVARRETADEFK